MAPREAAAPESHLPSENTTPLLAAAPSHPIPQSGCRASGDLFGVSLEASSKRGAKIRKVGGGLLVQPPRRKMRYLHLYLALIPAVEIPFFCSRAIIPGRLLPLLVKGKLLQLRIFLSLNHVVQRCVRNGHAGRCGGFAPYAL
jgi:hypothetical protein